MPKQPKLCDVMPPRDILDCLHAMEREGLVIPLAVDEWWLEQTAVDQKCENEIKREQEVQKKLLKIIKD